MGILRDLFKRGGTQDERPEEPPIPEDETLPDIVEGSAVGTRQLPSLESALLHPSQHMLYGHARDIGMVRANNEDSTFTLFVSQGNVLDAPDVGMFIIADGAGGHQEGERASVIASRVFADHVFRHLCQPMLDATQPEAAPPPIAEVLAEGVRAAHQAVLEAVPDGATTLTAMVTFGDRAHFAHVGDSRAYLIARDADSDDYRMEQLTRDHSVRKRLEEIGQMQPGEVDQHHESSRLWKLLGMEGKLEPDISTRRLPADAFVLLCSDGLWGPVSDDNALMEVVLNAATPQEACDRLIALANAHGGADNISAVVVKIPGG